MSIQQLLKQVLQSGQGITESTGSQLRSLAKNSGPGGFWGGALAGGLLGVLLGNKAVRKKGGKIVTYGAAAAPIEHRGVFEGQLETRLKAL